jgi:hypothetical protein
LETALADPDACSARRAACKVCAAALARLGSGLWVGGWILRDDPATGLALVVQMGGELAESSVELLEAGHHYAVAALVRQLVEVEYLVWAFGDDEQEAARWLHATPAEVRKLFSPTRMRKKAGGRFRDAEYWRHCDTGGHPNPAARHLLPDHSPTLSSNEWLWGDLAQHLDRLWRLLIEALDRHRWREAIAAEELSQVQATLARWHERDPLADWLPL